MRGYPQGFGNGRGGGGGGFGRRGLAPDPKTLHAIADRTGGKFFRAKSAGSVKDAYAALGSKLGRKPGTTEVTDLFLAARRCCSCSRACSRRSGRRGLP